MDRIPTVCQIDHTESATIGNTFMYKNGSFTSKINTTRADLLHARSAFHGVEFLSIVHRSFRSPVIVA